MGFPHITVQQGLNVRETAYIPLGIPLLSVPTVQNHNGITSEHVTAPCGEETVRVQTGAGLITPLGTQSFG